jgi:predicted TIM-barrel enzyme
MDKRGFLSLFSASKPVIGMLHGRGESDAGILDIMTRELELYRAGGIDGVLVENYFCTPKQAEMMLDYVAKHHGDIVYGVNLLGDNALNFRLAGDYSCAFMQIDSVCGHLAPEEDRALEESLRRGRESAGALLIGGVRFKYQPYLSGRSLEEDLRIGAGRCDAVAVTGDYTGQETDFAKIRTFRDILGDFPLVVAAGVTAGNAERQLAVCDACITGSYFKRGHDAKEEMDAGCIAEFMKAVRKARDAARDAAQSTARGAAHD